MESGAMKPNSLIRRILAAQSVGHLCPPLSEVWKAFELTAPESVKVVLLGQDPYHGAGQAHGLAFSVADQSLPLPPSLRNIFKERSADLGVPFERSADLSDWSRQGVFLLNTALTTEMGVAGKHRGLGWEEVVESALLHLMAIHPALVWVLWGKPAQEAHARVLKQFGEQREMDVLISSPHPSPLAAYRGFWESRPFSRVNSALINLGSSPIVW